MPSFIEMDKRSPTARQWASTPLLVASKVRDSHVERIVWESERSVVQEHWQPPAAFQSH
jgi:hypothetical protein